MDSYQNNTITVYEDDTFRSIEQKLIAEEPLSIRVEGVPYSVVMRTPGDEIFHTAGFCLAEGLIDHPDDIEKIGYCSEAGVNVATVTLVPERRKKVKNLLKRKGFVSQTSCGICGKELIKDLYQILTPIKEITCMSGNQAMDCVNQLPKHQQLHNMTHAAHAAMIFDTALKPVAIKEDVGRHNALDKAIGRVFMEGDIDTAYMAVLSSRISYELVQKAARARLQVVIGISRPTALAVELGSSINMTIASARESKLFVYSVRERIDGGCSEG